MTENVFPKRVFTSNLLFEKIYNMKAKQIALLILMTFFATMSSMAYTEKSYVNGKVYSGTSVDYTALNNKISEASTYMWNNLLDDKYDEIRWSLSASIEEAESLKMFDKTQAEIDAGVTALANALTKAMNDKKALDENPVVTVDYSALYQLYVVGANYYNSICDKEKYQEPADKLYNRLIVVQDLLNKRNAESQKQVDDLYSEVDALIIDVKKDVAAIDEAENAGKPKAQRDYEAICAEARAYYNEIESGYSSIASSFYNEYYRVTMDIMYASNPTDGDYEAATNSISKALKKAKDAVNVAKLGYNAAELTSAISDAVAYYNGIVDTHAAVAATLADAINKANTAKENLTCQADVDNAVVDIQAALTVAITAVKAETATTGQKNSLAFVTTTDGYSYHRKQYAYDENGRTIQALGMSLDSENNTWNLDTCYVYEYPDQFTTIEYAKTSHGTPEFVDGKPVYEWEWMHKLVTVNTTNAKEEKLFYYSSYEGDWSKEPSRVETTEYDAQGRVVKIISDYNMKEMEYDGDKTTVTSYYRYDTADDFTPSSKEATVRDVNGNMTKKEKYYRSNATWVISDTYEYTYSSDNVYQGYRNQHYQDGEPSYLSDNTYTVVRDEQGRIVKKVETRNGNVYSTIEYNGHVATEKVGNDKIFVRVLDGEGNLMRYTIKERQRNWNTYDYEWRTSKDVRYEYDRNVMAEDVIGGMKYLREPSLYDYEEDNPACVSYKLKYALARVINCGDYNSTQNIYSLQPITVKPASYDDTAAEPVITIPVANISDKVECAEGAMVEIVDEAGNVVFEKEITAEDLDAEKGMFSNGQMKIQGFSRTYHKFAAKELEDRPEETMMSGAKGAMLTDDLKANADGGAAIDNGIYFVQIAGGAVKVNGRVINQVMTALTVTDVIPGDADGDGKVTMADANMIVNEFLGNNPQGINKAAADVDGDGKVTIGDANIVINTFLGK